MKIWSYSKYWLNLSKVTKMHTYLEVLAKEFVFMIMKNNNSIFQGTSNKTKPLFYRVNNFSSINISKYLSRLLLCIMIMFLFTYSLHQLFPPLFPSLFVKFEFIRLPKSLRWSIFVRCRSLTILFFLTTTSPIFFKQFWCNPSPW